MYVACSRCHLQYDVGGLKKGEKVRCRCGTLFEVSERRSLEARMVHCSSCGGKLRTGVSSCDYCGCEVTRADRNLGPSCPECFANLPVKAKFCGSCGVEIKPAALKATHIGARCPRCEESLARIEVAGGEYTECSACAGIWLEEKAFQEIVDKKDAAALAPFFGASGAGGNSASEPAQEEQVRYLTCPTCGQRMNRKNFAACSGVIIDWCKGHGWWFDANELAKVIGFVREGGLDRARKLDIERQKAELATTEARKRAAQSGPLTPMTSAPYGESDTGNLVWWLAQVVGPLVGKVFTRIL